MKYPENTLLSFQNLLDLGGDVNEMDVQLTKDLVPVLFHDSTVDRTTNGTGPVSAYTLAELRTLDAGYTFSEDDGQTYPFRGKGVVIPTMVEVCQNIAGWLNIDIKDHSVEAVDLFVKAVSTVPGCTERLIGGSFNEITARALRRTLPDMKSYGSLAEIAAFTVRYYLGSSEQHDPMTDVYEVPTGYVLDIAGYIASANAIGVKMVFWTINTEREMERLLNAGADGIITDNVELAVEVFRRLGHKP